MEECQGMSSPTARPRLNKSDLKKKKERKDFLTRLRVGHSNEQTSFVGHM